MTKEDEMREKINTFMVRLDKMESRVKDVESVAATVTKLEAKLDKVEHRVEANEKSAGITPPKQTTPTPAPVKAFVSGVSIGLLVIGVIAAAWLLGFF
jgi:tetrahydromethanopterin S-methyltransferase subunit B